MPNEALRAAMAAARVAGQDLAEACGVDVKTVSRWLAQDGRVPHPRHRYAAADALGADPDMLCVARR
jgi:transcriptional regulator with XRE-family HTH domain